MFICRLIAIFFLLLIGIQGISAEDISSKPVDEVKDKYILSELTPVSYTKLTIDQKNSIAQMWNLSTTDYEHYLWLMNNAPSSIYYKSKNLDPSWILGFNAKDEPERLKYVAIAIKNERVRVANELAFQHDFDLLQRQMYPDLAPILWQGYAKNSK